MAQNLSVTPKEKKLNFKSNLSFSQRQFLKILRVPTWASGKVPSRREKYLRVGKSTYRPPNTSLLLARPLTSISQARRRNPRETQARVTPRAIRTAAPYFPRFGALPIWQTLIWSLSDLCCDHKK